MNGKPAGEHAIKVGTDVLRTYEKAFIGAAGGFSLVLLKLIDADFFVGAPHTKLLVGYLTYASYIVLGMIVSTYLTDHELSKEKGRRQALIMGLLAPSILIAIITNPNTGNGQSVSHAGLNTVPDLGFNISPVGKAYADDVAPSAAPSSAQKDIKIKVIKKSDVEIGYKEAFLSQFGRQNAENKFALVVGSSSNKDRATDVAKQLNTALGCHGDSTNETCAELLKTNQSNLVFVTIGGLQSLNSAQNLKLQSIETLLKPADSSQTVDHGELAALISNGKIIPGMEFLNTN